MRKNAFGDCFCHTVTEASVLIEDTSAVYVDEDHITEPVSDYEDWTAEIVNNDDGEIVCYVEGPTRDAVLAIIKALNIQVT